MERATAFSPQPVFSNPLSLEGVGEEKFISNNSELYQLPSGKPREVFHFPPDKNKISLFLITIYFYCWTQRFKIHRFL